MDIPGNKILRSKEFTKKLIIAITAILKEINRPVKFMHVCGTHEYTISKYGLRTLLPKDIEILSGPGCPVCICPAADIDKAIELGKRKDTIITTFGDMIRVPATNISLAELKAKGGDVRIVYGVNDAVKIAKKNPDKDVIFFAIGFETTAPLTGFEPNDVLLSLLMLLKQVRDKKYDTLNEYSRVVKPEGNKVAQSIIDNVFKPISSPWRGIGRISEGGLAIRERYKDFDADKKFDINIEKSQDIPPGCSCHLVMVGKLYPYECKLFKKECTPLNPIGPCMVSMEGTCSIYYKYH